LIENAVGPWVELPLWLPEKSPLPGTEKPMNGFMAIDNNKVIGSGLAFRPLSETIKDIINWERERSDELERTAGMGRKREQELLEKWKLTIK